jgi:hypothetical protein
MSDVLRLMAGDWSGDEQIAATRWGPGGAAKARVQSALQLGGKLLVQDYREERDGKPALEAHAVFVAEAEQGEFSLYWFDNYGFVPAVPAPGHWDGRQLVFLRSSPRGQTRHIYAPQDDGSYTLVLESSFDGGASWEPVLSGSYRRVS